MARTTLTPISVNSRAGVVETAGVAGTADGHQVPFANNLYFRVENVSVDTARVVSVKVAKLVDGLAVADKTDSIAFGTVEWLGPYTSDYRQDDGKVYLNFPSGDESDLVVQAFLFGG